MEKVDTDPNLQKLISSLWYGKEPQLDIDDPMILRQTWNTMKDIGTQYMWMGVLPTTTLCQLQSTYYQTIGLRKSGTKWGITLINKVLRATLALWFQRNEIVHAQMEEGLEGMEIKALYTAVENELSKGLMSLQPEDYYLLDTNIHRLRREPVEYIRGWLCSVKIARGDLVGAQQESIRDRGSTTHIQPNLSPREMN